MSTRFDNLSLNTLARRLFPDIIRLIKMTDTPESSDKTKSDLAIHGASGFDHVEKLDTQQASGVEIFDDSIEDTKPSKAVWLITITVAMGGFLFGKQPRAASSCR